VTDHDLGALIDSIAKGVPGETVRAIASELRSARTALTEAAELIGISVSDELCSFDHNGSCQMHNFYDIKPGELCPNERAKRWLAAHDND
jgi:hypothetical protein